MKWLFQDKITCCGSAQKKFLTVLLTKDVQNQSFVVETSLNVDQELSIEVANSSQSKVYYGSACEFLWYELLAKDLQEYVQEDVVESFLEVQRLDSLEVHLGEEIAEGGEAHIYFASCRKFNMPAVVKVFKRHLNLLQLQRRMEKVMRVARKRSSAICSNGCCRQLCWQAMGAHGMYGW